MLDDAACNACETFLIVIKYYCFMRYFKNLQKPLCYLTFMKYKNIFYVCERDAHKNILPNT